MPPVCEIFRGQPGTDPPEFRHGLRYQDSGDLTAAGTAVCRDAPHERVLLQAIQHASHTQKHKRICTPSHITKGGNLCGAHLPGSSSLYNEHRHAPSTARWQLLCTPGNVPSCRQDLTPRHKLASCCPNARSDRPGHWLGIFASGLSRLDYHSPIPAESCEDETQRRSRLLRETGYKKTHPLSFRVHCCGVAAISHDEAISTVAAGVGAQAVSNLNIQQVKTAAAAART